MTNRKEYTVEFKTEAVKLFKETGQTIIKVAKDYRQCQILSANEEDSKKGEIFLREITKVVKGTQASRMAANILRSEDMMWKFMRSPDLIETINNLAERQGRRYVIYRKNSFFTWSERGEKFVERMLSIFLTSRLNNKDPVQKLQNLVAIPA